MEKSEYNFQKLTPINDVELGVYKDALDFAFDHDDLKNIAISGQYSAGKSSLLESYKKNHPQIKFVHISLAHFRTEENPINGSGEPYSEIKLEGKILNQLLHQIDTDDIPQTNFKVKKKINPKSIFINTLYIIILAIILLHIILFENWSKFVSLLSDGYIKSLLTYSTKHDVLLVSGIALTILSFFPVRKLIEIQKNRNIFRKVKLQGNEIEIFEENNDSYFDRYLNEVLYLFDNVDAHAIVFEDMDRFNANHIFERLHEINKLVNIHRGLENNSNDSFKKKSTLRFLYLLRDDIFISKDRTKFFDYIIPVIPVVDSSNSYDQFISHFKKGDILNLFDENFLQGLSLYIDDMRILKNIYNEFQIYYNKLNITELDCNKMLAIVAYKNIFPRDFSELQINQGLVFTIFSNKGNFIDAETNRLEKEIDEKKDEIELRNEEILKSNEEIDIIYNRKKNTYNQHDPNYRAQIAKIENERNSRKAVIAINLENINDDLLKLKEELSYIKNKKLKHIITRENIDDIFKINYTNEIGETNHFNEIKSSEYFDLLKYLIRDGYIDESYADYMTYFYENSLSRIDKVFLRSITDQKGKEYTYQLKNPQLVVSRLKDIDFEQKETLNFDLLTYLLKSNIYENQLIRFFKQLRKNKNFEFINSYFEIEGEPSKYVINLNMQWPAFFSYALEEDEFSPDWIKRYSIATLYYSENHIINAINIDGCLTNYITKSKDYLDIVNPKIEKLINRLKRLNVLFDDIDFNSANKELFRAVYANSLYIINFANLALMLREVHNIENLEEIQHKNYTLVMSQPDSALTKYINDNFNDYIDIVLSSCNKSITDDEDIALSILNSDELSIEQKNNYISYLQTPITSLTDVEDNSLWEILLTNNKIIYSERNILSYFMLNINLDSLLVKFINEGKSSLDLKNAIFGKGQKNQFFSAIIKCNDLSNDKYTQLVCSANLYYEDKFSITDIDNDKLKILIDHNIIRMSLEHLEVIREYYSEQILYFVRKNIEIYIDIMNDEYLNLEEVTNIISWDIDDCMKIDLLSIVKTPIEIYGKNYSLAVNEYILNNNFDVNELLKLTSSFAQWDISIQKIILNLGIKYISTLINNPNQVSKELTKEIFSSTHIDNTKKVNLFIALLPDIKKEKEICREYLSMLNLPEFNKIISNRGKPKISIEDNMNLKILTAFKTHQLITGFETDEEHEYYKIIKVEKSMVT